MKQSLKRWGSLVGILIQRDLRLRYRGSMLGYFWSMLNLPSIYGGVSNGLFIHSPL